MARQSWLPYVLGGAALLTGLVVATSRANAQRANGGGVPGGQPQGGGGFPGVPGANTDNATTPEQFRLIGELTQTLARATAQPGSVPRAELQNLAQRLRAANLPNTAAQLEARIPTLAPV